MVGWQLMALKSGHMAYLNVPPETIVKASRFLDAVQSDSGAAYGYTTEDKDQMYYGLPAVLSSDRYVIVFDNSANGWLDIGGSEPDVLEFQAVAGRTAYVVVAGDSYPELIANYTDVTGRQPLPPRWAFGNFASRFGYRTEKETRDVVRRFRREEIPLDAVILDLYWFGPEVQGYMGDLDWDREAFPDPEGMISDFAQDGVRTITITEPFVLSTSSNWQDAVDNGALARSVTGEPRRFDFFFGNTGLVDVFDEDARQWFWQFYERLFEQGIAGTWGDLGLEGEWANKPISLYGRNSASGTYGYFKKHALFKGDYKDQVKEQPGSSSVVQGIASDKYGIGYSGIGYMTSDVRAVPLSAETGSDVEFMSAVPDNAYSGDYPLARFLYLSVNYKPGSRLDDLRGEFVRFIFSREGQEVVVKDGYIPLPAKVSEREKQKLK